MPLGHPPQLIALVVAVHDGDLPAVFVHEEDPLLVDVAGVGLQVALDMPDPVQFIAGHILVDVTRADDIGHLHLVGVEHVGVVGDEHLLLAQPHGLEPAPPRHRQHQREVPVGCVRRRDQHAHRIAGRLADDAVAGDAQHDFAQ